MTTLSGGERRRVALCRLLCPSPRCCCSTNRPTISTPNPSRGWKVPGEVSGTVVAVTHDRYFLDNVAGWILELDRGHGIPWEGNYSSWLAQRKRASSKRNVQAAHRKAVASELEWVRQNAKGRQAKSRARLARFEELQSREFQARNETNEIYIPPGPRLGNVVVDVEHVSKAFGDRLLIDDLSFSVPPGGIVGVIGANGAGKTTLFRMVTGRDQPDAGSIRVGDTVEFAYVDQSRDSLEPKNTVWQEISGGHDILTIGEYELQSRAYCGRFNSRVPISRSWSANSRAASATVCTWQGIAQGWQRPAARRTDQRPGRRDPARAGRGAAQLPGCAIVISHDRWFLDRTATHILAFEGDSHVEWFPGNFSDYEADRRERMGEEADKPHRIKYKPVVR